MAADYRVELDIYNGPLDLLLYLIKRDELDIYDIPISRITESYMGYVAMLKEMTTEHGLDINIAGDFLVVAATLMEIKSATLLPRQPAETSEDPSAMAELSDPRYELVQKLLEYKRFKDRAAALEVQQETHNQRFPRIPAKLEGQGDEPPPVDLEEVQVWDLLAAFNQLMQEVGHRAPRFHEVVYDDTPIDLHAADIEDRLKREDRISFRQLLEGRKSRSEMIGVFLALLELIREKKVLVQDVPNSNDFEVINAPEEHRNTYAQASLHLADEAPPAPEAEIEIETETEEPTEAEAAEQ